MFPNRTDVALTALLFFTVALIAFATSAINTTVAQAYTLGAADGSTQAAPLAAHLGARTYRLVIDSTQPLSAYDARIEAYRAQGMRPQITVDGVGTERGYSNGNITLAYAVAAFRRWPDTYSISVIGEPEGHVPACDYARYFNRAYRTLKRAGVPLILFGELMPFTPLEYTTRAASCGRKITADGWSWHCYDWRPGWEGINQAGRIQKALGRLRRSIHTPRGFALPMHCTEYGLLTVERDGQQHYNPPSQSQAAASWGRALGVARRRLVQIVVWQILPSSTGSGWDTSIVTRDGRKRPAFNLIASRQ